MNDGINGSDDTDRLLIHWDLDAADVIAACAGQIRSADAEAERSRGAVIALGRSADGKPEAGSLAGRTALIAVPPDIEAMRATDPGGARDWRAALRDVLATAMAEGRRVVGFDRSGWYVVTIAADEEGN
jgi:predicted GNAT superfamily acetyltransferase